MVHFVTAEERLTSQEGCSTSYDIPQAANVRRSTAFAEVFMEFEFQPDLRHTQPGRSAFASVCFAALSPSQDSKAAGRPLLGVCPVSNDFCLC